MLQVLQEIVGRRSLSRDGADIRRGVCKHFILLAQPFIKLQNRSNISTPITVIWGAPDGDYGSIEHQLVTLHGQLMCSSDQVYGVIVDESLRDVGAEEISGTSRGYAPSFDVVRIRPKEVAHWPIVRNFLFSVNCADLYGVWSAEACL